LTGGSDDLVETSFLSVPDPTAIEPSAGLFAQNPPGSLPPSIPVFVARGATDAAVPPRITADHVGKLRAAGSVATVRILPAWGAASAPCARPARPSPGSPAALPAGRPGTAAGSEDRPGIMTA